MTGDRPIREGDVVYFIHVNNMVERVRLEIMAPAPVISAGIDYLVIHADRGAKYRDRDFIVPRCFCSHDLETLESRYPEAIIQALELGATVGYLDDGDPRHGIVVERGGTGGYHWPYSWVDVLDRGRVVRVNRNSAWLIAAPDPRSSG